MNESTKTKSKPERTADNTTFTLPGCSTLPQDRQLTRKRFNNIKSIINGIYAIEDGIVTHNPVKDISSKQFTFKPVNHSDNVFTLAERKTLLEHLAGIPAGLLVECKKV